MTQAQFLHENKAWNWKWPGGLTFDKDDGTILGELRPNCWQTHSTPRSKSQSYTAPSKRAQQKRERRRARRERRGRRTHRYTKGV